MKNIISFFTDADAKRAYVLLAIVILMAAPFFLTALYFQNEAGWIKWLTTFITAGVSFQIGRLFLSHIESMKDADKKDNIFEPRSKNFRTRKKIISIDLPSLEVVLDCLWIVFLISFGAFVLYLYSGCLNIMSDIPQWGCALILAAFAIWGVFMPTKDHIIRLTKSLQLKVIGNMPNPEEEDDSEVRVLGYTLPQEEEDDSEVRVLSCTLPQKEEDDSEVEVIGYTKPKTE